MSIALRFIPTLAGELDRIMKAQKARGADFETGGPIRRVRSLVPVLVPLFMCAFRRADGLALALESCCWRGPAGRSRWLSRWGRAAGLGVRVGSLTPFAGVGCRCR